MARSTKTVGDGQLSNNPLDRHDPMRSLKKESVERMKVALLSATLDDPLSAVTALQQVTMMRAYHQVVRIVQYLDLMDDLESKLYESIEAELDNIELNSDSQFAAISKLLAIQEKLQKSIVESNKMLAPYLDMEQYPAFTAIDVSTSVSANVLDVSSSKRNALRENAGAILSELSSLPQPDSIDVAE